MKLEWENGLHLFREDLTSHACDYFHASQNIDVFMIVSAEPIRESHQNSVATRGAGGSQYYSDGGTEIRESSLQGSIRFPIH